MTTKFYQSNALVTLVHGEHFQDLQILIDDRQLFNRLPGKSERKGVKSLAAWPFFVTAIFNEPSRSTEYLLFSRECTDGSPRICCRCLPAAHLRSDDHCQPSGLKSRKRKVEKTLSEIRKLHEDLNSELYAHPTERPSIHSPADAFNLLLPFLGMLDHEELWIINLDIRNRVMNLTKLYQGSVNMSQVRVGEVFRQAITDNSPSIVVAHNHPSGDPSPSPDDVNVTRAIVQAGKLLDIEVLDHLVIASERFVSLKERGLGVWKLKC